MITSDEMIRETTLTSSNQLVANQKLLNNFFKRLKSFNKCKESECRDVSKATRKKKIKSYVGGKLRVTYLDDVIYFKSEDKYTVVKHKEGISVIDNTLIGLETEVGKQFIRIHRNALVAKEKIIGYEKTGNGQFRVMLDGLDEQLNVSRRHESGVRKLFRKSKDFLS